MSKMKTSTLLFYAKACKAAYEIGSPKKVFPEHEVTRFNFSNTSAYVVDIKNENSYIVVFRGSDQLRDLTQAVGFRAWAYRVLFRKILERYPNMKYRNVVTTGHSWGGCLAILFAHKIGAMACLTYGSPALVEKLKGYKTRTWRVVNYGDPIPRIGKNKHYGNLVRIGNWCFCKRIRKHLIKSYIRVLLEKDIAEQL